MIIKFVKFSKCETHIVCVKQRSNPTCNYLWTLILERPNNGPKHIRQSPRCQIFCKYVWMYWSFLQIHVWVAVKSIAGFCFTPLNLNLFSNSSFHLNLVSGLTIFYPPNLKFKKNLQICTAIILVGMKYLTDSNAI